MKKVLLYLLPLLLLGAAFAAEDVNPALETFNNAITFYTSFDGHAIADLSNGKGAPTGNAQKLQYQKGIWGKALHGQNNNLIYDAKDNIDLVHSGSLLLWIVPDGAWTDADKPIQLSLAAVHDQGKSLLLARQGGKSNHQALLAIYGSNFNDAKTRALVKNSSTASWKNGEWHLLAVNWSRGYVELSVDGGLFSKGNAKAPDAKPTDNNNETLAVAGRSTEKSPYLIDELMILNRPLTNDEVKVLFQEKTKTP